MPYWRLHYHLVWATWKREWLLDDARTSLMRAVIYHKAKELGLLVHAVGSVEDHVHVVVSIPPKRAVADAVRHFKGASSYAFNHTLESQTVFKWQEGYGAISLGQRSLRPAVAYANNQIEHHRAGTTVAFYERCSEVEEGVAQAADDEARR